MTITQVDASGLVASLQMPQISIPAGGTMMLDYFLQPIAANGGDSMDFMTRPARLCLRGGLPPSLSTNLAVPMNWCTQ